MNSSIKILIYLLGYEKSIQVSFVILYQMLLSLVSGLSRSLSGLSSAGHSSGQEFLRSDAVNVEHEIERTFCKTLFVVKASIKLKDIDVIFDVPAVDDKFERLVELDDSKIWSSVEEACIELSCEENKCLINVDLCKLQSVLFKFEGNIWKSSGNFITESLLFRSHDILFEACLSSCLLSVSMDCPSPSALGDACCMTGDFTGKEHNVQVQREVNTLDSASDSLPSNSTRWIHINLALTDLFVARGSTKNVLVEVRRSSNFVTSVCIGRKFKSISCSVEVNYKLC